MPDLRNEFLRGYGELSEDIGLHQDATEHLNNGAAIAQNAPITTGTGWALNKDTEIEPITKGYTSTATMTSWASTGTARYTSRPTNVAVLYCIKY